MLFATASAHADPINIASLPPRPEILCSLLVEVIIVAAVLWRFRFRAVRFLIAWYAVNLFTFYFLLQRLMQVQDSFIIGELVVFAVEAVALFGLSKLPFFRSMNAKPMPFGWAVAASVVGNVSSILAFWGISALE
jgi:uncharacterized membrane protein